ncbi:MAG: hypothetical protein IJ735_05775 [Clostridia bacterium]|nr:hypothetical protein [Clostridia bacterium]
MINGNVNEFVDGLYYGDERWFLFRNRKYFIQGWIENNNFSLALDQVEPDTKKAGYLWIYTNHKDKKDQVVECFLTANLFDGKTFWEIENEIIWVDE